MEAQENNERYSFEILCETIRKFALSISNSFVRSLNLDQLTEKEKAKSISLQIRLLTAEVWALGRPEYFFKNDSGSLFEFFKSSGYLDNAEELKKLQQAKIMNEKFARLQLMLLDANERCKTVSRNVKWYPHSFHDDKEELALYQVLLEIDKDIHLVIPPSSITDFTSMALCQDWSCPKEPIYGGCKTNELKCVVDCIKRFNPSFNYANIGRCGLFISKAGIPVTAHDLATSTTEKLKTKAFIEFTFAKFRKKN